MHVDVWSKRPLPDLPRERRMGAAPRMEEDKSNFRVSMHMNANSSSWKTDWLVEHMLDPHVGIFQELKKDPAVPMLLQGILCWTAEITGDSQERMQLIGC
jgi:hypothetical protein